MGCCASKSAELKANQMSRWRSTGIVALHDVLNLDKSVRTLDLTHNKIVDIPMEISKLINIQRLVSLAFHISVHLMAPFRRHNLKELLRKTIAFGDQEKLIYYIALLTYELRHCNLHIHISVNFSNVLDDNNIERLPINLGKLQSLKVMTLDGNRITSLPDELGQLVRLERLSILGNMLTCLPETIGSLRNLVLLNVSNNKLKSLPESIGSCYSLEELQANDNLIGELPASICNLIHLKSLCLNNNNVGQIPANLLKDCKALQNISLHNNPISMDQFQQMEGFEEFEARRRKKFDKQIDSNVMISSKGLDEGVDK
ncbi:hypothetical protein CUMW_168150 [Citrus unshiu]|uniref:Disease resistance R13L4/SHOC-2-like LRR domain-containing protein n=2 Tax=Citrus TaxID=2706 RepID=A0A2H5PUC3_CITUN|nr:hypothetical protein CUMW_168150 [Citrus unshiu]